MEPRIRFAKTSDGVAIAFWTEGEGVPLVHMPWLPWSHVQLEWQNPQMQRWYAALSSHATLIRYDSRGTGLSDRNYTELDVDAQMRDIDAVVASLGIKRFVLLGVFHSGPTALLYAACHPERVAGLVLWCTYASGEAYNASPTVASIRNLIDDWQLYTETGAHAFIGWEEGQSAHELAVLMRESVEHSVARRFLQLMQGVDCRDSLASIKAPTLVLHPRRFPLIDVALARDIVAAIPDARLVAVEGDSMAPTLANMDNAIDAIREILAPLSVDQASRGQRAPAPAAFGHGAQRSHDGLTAREIEVLRLAAQGKSNREIAEQLVLSPRTVERHVANIYAKANVNNRAQITVYALTNGLAEAS